MATIVVKPSVFKNYLLKVGADNYEKHVNSVALTPSSTLVTVKGGTPDAVFTDQTTPTWVCDVSYLQDWETTNSFSVYLLNNIGKTVAMEFSPLGSGPKFTANVIINSGAAGGAIDAYGASTVQFGVKGAPAFVPGTVTP